MPSLLEHFKDLVKSARTRCSCAKRELVWHWHASHIHNRYLVKIKCRACGQVLTPKSTYGPFADKRPCTDDELLELKHHYDPAKLTKLSRTDFESLLRDI